MTRRGKIFVLVAAVLVVLVGAVGVMAVTGKGPAVLTKPLNNLGVGSPAAPPPTCPLTGQPAPGGQVPQRPMLAIKVENLPDARPQYGLDKTDIIYEEPVEGGITRFIAMFQCQDASRVEPVRSARTTDPEILMQYGTPKFGYADAAGYVENAVKRVKAIDDVNWQNVPSAYHHDSSRAAPHDLYTSTKELWKAGTKGLKPPPAFFTYGAMTGKAKTAKDVELNFSDYSDVHWQWDASKNVWLRSHGTVPHMNATGGQVQATNVIVQVVDVANSKHLDPASNPVPEVTLTGGGKAYLLRDGKMYSGTWSRKSDKVDTTYTTKSGQQFVLNPGNTWVELFPSDRGKVKP